MNEFKAEQEHEIHMLCYTIRLLVNEKNYGKCKEHICNAMQRFPHSAVPHNLIGIVLEKEDCHPVAMKHFRAAWVLDPTYLPARHNLEYYGTFFQKGSCAYDESDCKTKIQTESYVIQYDERGVGRAARRG